jgi:hypothetical protein
MRNVSAIWPDIMAGGRPFVFSLYLSILDGRLEFNMSRPLTTLDKWRRKAFTLTHELAEMKAQHQKDELQFQAAEEKMSQNLRDTERSIVSTEKQNAQLSKEQKLAEIADRNSSKASGRLRLKE